ncbi:GNAT family N-acetyltransferase [Thalassotalea sp. PLHSN55]|uniref:GNAT family N-acetyltransferase n=1 Tax=Thalassotalea sp. PLHSN55 TaxID=3435888 RepID=UPI003F867E38
MKTVVCELSLHDRTGWESLYRGYADFYQVPMNQEILDNVWSWIFDENQQFYALIAKDEAGHCLGLMHYRAMPSPARGKFVGFLDDLFVAPTARGTGAVDALFEALNNAATKNGWPFVRWLTADNNYKARSVYDKLAERTQWITYQMPAN